MIEVVTILIGIVVLTSGIPIGKLLAKVTKEELRSGKKWFKLLIILSLVAALVFLIFRNDALFFGLLFIAIVASQSLKR